MTDRNDAQWVRESVIQEVRNGAQYASSGAWVARRHPNGEIGVYKHQETL